MKHSLFPKEPKACPSTGDHCRDAAAEMTKVGVMFGYKQDNISSHKHLTFGCAIPYPCVIAQPNVHPEAEEQSTTD